MILEADPHFLAKNGGSQKNISGVRQTAIEGYLSRVETGSSFKWSPVRFKLKAEGCCVIFHK